MDTSIMNNTKIPHLPHPFYPLEVEIVGYLANDWSVPALLGLFAAGWAVILAVTLSVVKRFNPQVPSWERAVIMWFILSGTIHFFFEGYFAFNHAHMAGMNDFFAQLWKEYSLSDSRYLTSDPFVLCMETVTAVLWGPLSYIVAWMIVIEHPLRYPLQALVCIGELFGLVLPEAYYFWFYYFFMNFIWMVIPGWLLYVSIDKTAKAFEAVKKMSKTVKGNGNPKKSN
ncbi:MAG: hypothetical protein MMC33_010202 [Icmadophila ericetorum]|nr:hypothetical protein [Icmadophila ericetorum]